jgi:hypothetical protein
MLEYNTIQEVRREIDKLINEKKNHIVYNVDTIEKLQYSRGQLSSLEELLQVIKDLLKKEDIEDDNDPG